MICELYYAYYLINIHITNQNIVAAEALCRSHVVKHVVLIDSERTDHRDPMFFHFSDLGFLKTNKTRQKLLALDSELDIECYEWNVLGNPSDYEACGEKFSGLAHHIRPAGPESYVTHDGRPTIVLLALDLVTESRASQGKAHELLGQLNLDVTTVLGFTRPKDIRSKSVMMKFGSGVHCLACLDLARILLDDDDAPLPILRSSSENQTSSIVQDTLVGGLLAQESVHALLKSSVTSTWSTLFVNGFEHEVIAKDSIGCCGCSQDEPVKVKV